jgi:hypothetical protein
LSDVPCELERQKFFEPGTERHAARRPIVFDVTAETREQKECFSNGLWFLNGFALTVSNEDQIKLFEDTSCGMVRPLSQPSTIE